jgi:hypothetical protein
LSSLEFVLLEDVLSKAKRLSTDGIGLSAFKFLLDFVDFFSQFTKFVVVLVNEIVDFANVLEKVVVVHHVVQVSIEVCDDED